MLYSVTSGCVLKAACCEASMRGFLWEEIDRTFSRLSKLAKRFFVSFDAAGSLKSEIFKSLVCLIFKVKLVP